MISGLVAAEDLAFGPEGAGSGLADPRGLAFAPDGHLWVSSYGTDEVLEFDPSGILVGVHGRTGPAGQAARTRQLGTVLKDGPLGMTNAAIKSK
jgi:hypothetical protein